VSPSARVESGTPSFLNGLVAKLRWLYRGWLAQYLYD
jgi:hypothetical protein